MTVLSKIKYVLACCIALLTYSMSCAQSVGPVQASTWIAKQILDGYPETGQSQAELLGSRNWHFVFLFNSSQAADMSAYTDFSRTMTLKFLRDRLEESQKNGSKHKFSFFPYQLDLYKGNESLQGLDLNRENVDRLESLFPTRPFQLRGDAVSPYPKLGGHDNEGVRHDLEELLGTPNAPMPIIIVQITNYGISEAPGDIAEDSQKRGGLSVAADEKSGYQKYPNIGSPFLTDPPASGKKPFEVHVLIFGPAQIDKVVVHSSSMPGILKTLGIGVSLLVGLGLVVWILSRLRNSTGGFASISYSITIGNHVPIVIEKGEKLQVVGQDYKGLREQKIFEWQVAGVSPSLLFEISNEKELEVISRVGTISFLSHSDNGKKLSEGENEINFKDGSFARNLKIIIRRMD